tara:strand:- start:191 stop:370 length:180 start_codon:yes stop_codon:yes gene_type:complete
MSEREKRKQLYMEIGRSMLVNRMEKLLKSKEYKDLSPRESISFQTNLSQYTKLENKFQC